MPWSKLTFGKHKGKTLPQVLFTDPDWFFWAMGKGVFEKRSGLVRSEANDIFRKARRIRIPGNESGNLEAEYFIHSPTDKFSHFGIVSATKPQHIGSSPTFRSDVIDLSIPRQIAEYDKLGCKQMIRSLKIVLFNNESERMTKNALRPFLTIQTIST